MEFPLNNHLNKYTILFKNKFKLGLVSFLINCVSKIKRKENVLIWQPVKMFVMHLNSQKAVAELKLLYTVNKVANK